MDWTEVCIRIPAIHVDEAAAIANMAVPYGIYIEDYSDLEQGAWDIAHIDLIDEELGARDRENAKVHIYISPEENPAEAMSFIRERIEAGTPILVGWNDWGGHWQVIIGYDTMGTEYEGDDVIIVADPFDTTDHNQDGYGVYGAERFIYNFTFFDFFGDAPDHARDKCFVAVSPMEA